MTLRRAKGRQGAREGLDGEPARGGTYVIVRPAWLAHAVLGFSPCRACSRSG